MLLRCNIWRRAGAGAALWPIFGLAFGVAHPALAAGLRSVAPAQAAVAAVGTTRVTWTPGLPQPLNLLLVRGLSAFGKPALAQADLPQLFKTLNEQLHKAGYLVAQVGVMPDDLAVFQRDGTLRLTVLPGEVADVRVARNSSHVKDVRLQRTARHALCPKGVGKRCIVTSKRLERMTLLLQDLPGVSPDVPSLNPDKAPPGQTFVELGAKVSPTARLFSGGASANNFGYASSGTYQFAGNAALTDLFGIGDVFSLAGSVSDKGTWTGSFGASAPVGYDGLRLVASYARTQFSLPSVNATGNADAVHAGLAYPLVRGLDANWTASAEGSWSRSRQSIAGMSAFPSRRLYGFRLSLQGDTGDRSFIPGANFRSVSIVYSHGQVDQDLNGGVDTTGVLGAYNKFYANLTARQYLGHSQFYLLGNLRAQYATRNLDGSEKLTIGGPSAVRAYRVDEGGFDQGAILTLELRRLLTLRNGDRFAPGVIFDVATGDYVHHTYPSWQSNLGYPVTSLGNSRTFSGAGIGADYHSHTGLNFSLTWSHALPGKQMSVNYPSGRDRVWFSAGIQF